MADGKFLTDETKDLVVDVLDELKNWGILEPVEKPIYKLVLNQVDHFADKFVPDYLDDEINAAVVNALEGNYEAAAEQVGLILDQLIDLEKVADSTEKLVFVDGLKFVVRQIQLFIEKKKD